MVPVSHVCSCYTSSMTHRREERETWKLQVCMCEKLLTRELKSTPFFMNMLTEHVSSVNNGGSGLCEGLNNKVGVLR